MIRYALLVSCSVAALLTASCASSPPVRFYGLDPVSAVGDDKPSDVIMGVGPISIPEYLRRPQIVTRTAGNQLEVAEFDRWAEPVDRAFGRVLTLNLDALLDSVIAIQFPTHILVTMDYRMLGRVARFDMDAGGETVLDVQWAITDGDGNVVVQPRRSIYSARVSDPDDYNSVVRSLNEAIGAFSRDIASEFRAATE